MNPNQYTAIMEIIRIQDVLTPTAKTNVKENVELLMGPFFWKDSEVAVKISAILDAIPDTKRACNMISECLGMTKVHDSISNEMIKDLGNGFCYLNIIQEDMRHKALSVLRAWPEVNLIVEKFRYYIHNFHLEECFTSGDQYYAHMVPGPAKNPDHVNSMLFWCFSCKRLASTWLTLKERDSHEGFHMKGCIQASVHCPDKSLKNIRAGGFMDSITRRRSSSTAHSRPSSRRSISNSTNHEDKQVLSFAKSIKGQGIEPDMTRELLSVPKPAEIETMADHIQNHKPGDVFPYFSVVGTEEESKDSRLARLRAFKSAYGKENKPEMRINGVVLDEIEGTIKVREIGDHVNQERLNKKQVKENKKFKPLSETSFKKPYLQISRITGEYVPLMSSTSDYTELFFTLEDGRLLDNETIVQSNKIATNQNGVFELSCDYCISIKDIDQLSLKYFLSRPIMKDNFQWGSVSLTVRVSESDTPYLTPKVEAMAITRAPFTTLEEQAKDPDHADIVYTSSQIKTFRDMYRAGDIMDIDEAKKERTKMSSYSKSSLRGAPKGDAGPEHLGNQDGWEHLKGMVKPRLEEGQASVSVISEDEDDIDVPTTTKAQYEAEQERLRSQFQNMGSDTTEEIADSDAVRSSSPNSEQQLPSIGEITPPRSSMKKTRFSEPTLQEPDTKNVFRFD